jgi:hypothetical protein
MGACMWMLKGINMLKPITLAIYSHRFLFNLTASFYSPSSYSVTWETIYPSMWSVISDMCDIEPLQITKTMPYRITAYLYDCSRLPQQKFIVRNGDLDVYNRCVLDMLHANSGTHLQCDFYRAKK